MEYISVKDAKAEAKKSKKAVAKQKRLDRREAVKREDLRLAEAVARHVEKKAEAAEEAAREVKRRLVAPFGLVFREDLFARIDADWAKFASEFPHDCYVLRVGLVIYRSSCPCTCTPGGKCAAWKKRNELLYAKDVSASAPSIGAPLPMSLAL